MTASRTYLIFGDIEGELDTLRVECTKCVRKDRYSVPKPAAFLRGARHRLADSSLRLNPRAGCRFGLERTGERMLGTAQRRADEKT